jgi:DNA-binding Lrp family transcriptional regulator
MKSELLYMIQNDFPLAIRPFKVLADRLGIDESSVISILQEEKEKKIIRQISPIYDTKRLGYSSSLISFKIAREDISKAVEIINSHPGVSHNYEREHPFNIWFTLAVPKDSKLGFDRTVEILAKETRAIDYIVLPTIKMFKIAVKLNLDSKGSPKREKVKKRIFKDIELTPKIREVIALSQVDIPLVEEPFKETINRLDMDYDEFFNILNTLKDAGVMRRFAGILNHKRAGFNANAMVVWDIDDNLVEEMGKIASSFKAVSHCYLRPRYPKWPYNLFTMVHGKSDEETNAIIAEMADELEHFARRPLYSTREFKKRRIKYFSNDFDIWESGRLGIV